MEMNEISLWRLPKVMAVTGLSKPTIYRKVKNSSFPKPRKLSERAVGWRSDEIRAWTESRVTA